jgi:hypothetical protein
MTDYAALNKMVRRHRAALTRAKNSGSPEKVLAAVAEAYADFDATMWPDGWHTWEIAYRDAEMAIARRDW